MDLTKIKFSGISVNTEEQVVGYYFYSSSDRTHQIHLLDDSKWPITVYVHPSSVKPTKECLEELKSFYGEDCPHCPNQGWYVVSNSDSGEPEQEQCRFCYTTPNSKFNLNAPDSIKLREDV